MYKRTCIAGKIIKTDGGCSIAIIKWSWASCCQIHHFQRHPYHTDMVTSDQIVYSIWIHMTYSSNFQSYFLSIYHINYTIWYPRQMILIPFPKKNQHPLNRPKDVKAPQFDQGTARIPPPARTLQLDEALKLKGRHRQSRSCCLARRIWPWQRGENAVLSLWFVLYQWLWFAWILSNR